MIEWEDAASDGGDWESYDETTLDPIKTYTVGWLVKQTKQYVVVCHTINAEDSTAGRMVVPYRMLKSIRTVAAGSASI
jgi:hypothetical protein